MSHERKLLQLPNLSIKHFRGIDSLSIERLGRVTLLADQNGVGKTTVLEAIRTYAARGHRGLLHELLNTHEEYSRSPDENGDQILSPNFEALFHGRIVTKDRPITIGPISGEDTLSFSLCSLNELSSEQRELLPIVSIEAGAQAIQVRYREKNRMLTWVTNSEIPFSKRFENCIIRKLQHSHCETDKWPIVNCESLGPELPNNEHLARCWDSITLAGEENITIEFLRLVYNTIERVIVVDDSQSRIPNIGRRLMVKFSDHSCPVPLNCLGNGTNRIFATGLVLSCSRDGFLVIDEVENGIHYSVLPDFWRMVLRSAHHHNVQVLATTHSLDCVKSFAKAANEIEESEGVLVRLDQDDGQTRAVEYSEEELGTVAEQNIEVR